MVGAATASLECTSDGQERTVWRRQRSGSSSRRRCYREKRQPISRRGRGMRFALAGPIFVGASHDARREDHPFQGRRRETHRFVGFPVVAFVLAGQSPAVAAQLASKEDAVVSATDTGWVVANALVTYAVGFDANGDLVVQDLRRTGDTHSWRPSPVRDTVFRIDDRELGLTRSNAAGFRHTGADVADVGTGLELRLTFEDRATASARAASTPSTRRSPSSRRGPSSNRSTGARPPSPIWSRCSWSSTAPWLLPSTASRARPRPADPSRSGTR